MQVEEKTRAAYLQGAEEHSRATLGRLLTQEELDDVRRRYRTFRDVAAPSALIAVTTRGSRDSSNPNWPGWCFWILVLGGCL